MGNKLPMSARVAMTLTRLLLDKRYCLSMEKFSNSPGIRGSRLLKQFRMELIEKLISENHRDEFSTTSGRPNISPSLLRLISIHFPDVIPATEKIKFDEIPGEE
ncbi:hypothetical protein TNCV_3904831 [Trichonephila clavipes]|nr:hypothetical protein TNCV_3904831 [Trichonephila clavipes]